MLWRNQHQMCFDSLPTTPTRQTPCHLHRTWERGSWTTCAGSCRATRPASWTGSKGRWAWSAVCGGARG